MLFPFAIYAFYNLAFIQKNRISNKYEWKFFSPVFEKMVVGPLITRRILRLYDGKIFRDDTGEVEVVAAVLKHLIVSNNFDRIVSPSSIKIKVLYDDTVFLFLSPDNTFFITYRALTLCDKHPHLLSLLIAHELAHHFLGHQ